MNKLNILTFPDPRLRKTAEPVKDFNDELKSIASDMLHTMYVDKIASKPFNELFADGTPKTGLDECAAIAPAKCAAMPAIPI